jgi:hypothetical protein
MQRHNWTFLTALLTLALAGCRPGHEPSAVASTQPTAFSTGSRVNLARAGRLAGAAALEIARFSAQGDANHPYTLVTTIGDRETLDRFVRLLDQELDVGPVPACIAEYELRFRRADGVAVTFGYTCGAGGAYFIRTQASDQSLSVLGQVKLPDEFRKLVSAQLATAAPAPNFAFRFEYGPCFTDVLDSFEHTYLQDRGVNERSITIPISLTAVQLQTIHAKLVAIDFFSYPEQFAIQPPDGERVIVTPANRYSLTVRDDQRRHTVAWLDGIVQPTTPEADRLRELFQLIVSLIQAQPDILQLPPRPFACL